MLMCPIKQNKRLSYAKITRLFIILLMPVSVAWLLSKRHHIPTAHSFFHICLDLHCCAVWAGSRSLGVHLSPHPTHLVVFKTASVNREKALAPYWQLVYHPFNTLHSCVSFSGFSIKPFTILNYNEHV